MIGAYLKRLGVGPLELVLVVGLATLSATGSRPTRIAPRSRENAASTTRRLRGSSSSAPALQYCR